MRRRVKPKQIIADSRAEYEYLPFVEPGGAAIVLMTIGHLRKLHKQKGLDAVERHAITIVIGLLEEERRERP